MGAIVPQQRLMQEQEKQQAAAASNKHTKAGADDLQRQNALFMTASRAFNISVNFAFVDHSQRIVACTVRHSTKFIHISNQSGQHY
jgi:hypothetical protein